MITAILTRSTTDLSALKAHLRLSASTAQDADLTRKLNAAKTMADQFCQNNFLDSEGEPLPIPADVEEWVLQKATDLYLRRSNNVQETTVQGSHSVKYKEKEDYTLLKSSRRNPGLGATRVE